MDENEPLQCIDNDLPYGLTGNECRGPVEYRTPLSGTGKSFPRCDKHWEIRLETQRGINERYPAQQPADFDPGYAGESWYED